MNFFARFFSSKPTSAENAHLTAAVEHVINSIDPRLSTVNGAREQLMPAVERALDNIDETIAKIPASIALTPESWSASPLLRAFFTRPAEINSAISISLDVRDYIKKNALPTQDTLYGVVVATRVERITLGHAIEDGLLKQDVAQKSVSFTNMRLLGFAGDEPSLRRHLIALALKQLVLIALRDMADNKLHSEQLGAYRALLQTRLRLLESGSNGADGIDALGAQSDPDASDIAQLRRQLAENELALQALRPNDGMMNSGIDATLLALNDADAVIQPKLIKLRLNAMNIVLSDKVQDADASEIELVEFSTANPNHPRRVGFLAHFPRSAFVEKAVDFDAMLRAI